MPQKERDVFIREAADQAIFDSSSCGKTGLWNLPATPRNNLRN